MDRYALISAFCSLVGLAVSCISLSLVLRRKLSEEERELGAVLSELGFLKNGIEEIRRDIREIMRGMSEVESRLARVEENNAQTQKRMDVFDSRGPHGHDNAVS